MKRPLPFFALCLNVGLICLVAALMPDYEGHDPSLILTAQATPPGTAERDAPGPLFVRRRSETGYQLTYGWKDFGDKSYVLSFAIADDLIARSEAEIGYDPNELERITREKLLPARREMITDLKAFTEREINKSGLDDFITIDEEQPLQFKLRMNAPPDRREEIKEAFIRITQRLAVRQERLLKAIEKERAEIQKGFVQERGLKFYGKRIGVDYGKAVNNNKRRILHVLEKMRDLSPKKSILEFLSISLSFIQEMTYGIPPFMENNRIILGFWPPPKVLANNFGDCDSKGVAFASLWTNFRRYPILLIKIPKHMLVGLGIPSPRESGVEINGLRYTLCEVTGPGKLPAGIVTSYSRLYLDGGNYSYELVR
jgi:hypothetical protein